MKQTKKKYIGLSSAERSEIQILLSRKYSIRRVAEVLERSPNTISREVRVNSVTNLKTGVLEYVAIKAKAKSRVSRRSRRYQWQKIEHNNELRSFIINKLAPPNRWSPNEVSGYLKRHPELGFYVSNKQLYAWLYSSQGQLYCQYLYSKRYRPRKRRKNKTKRMMIPDRRGIEERPETALDRFESGHCEYDSVVSSKRSKSTAALAVVQERSTRLVRASLVPNLKPGSYAQAIIRLMEGVKIRTMTTDNGIENKQHKAISRRTGVPVYFTDPYSSWQKGSVENANKMIRRYFPKGTDFSKVAQTQVDQALWTINNKPRQSLGFKSAIQCAVEKGLLLDQVSY